MTDTPPPRPVTIDTLLADPARVAAAARELALTQFLADAIFPPAPRLTRWQRLRRLLRGYTLLLRRWTRTRRTP